MHRRNGNGVGFDGPIANCDGRLCGGETSPAGLPRAIQTRHHSQCICSARVRRPHAPLRSDGSWTMRVCQQNRQASATSLARESFACRSHTSGVTVFPCTCACACARTGACTGGTASSCHGPQSIRHLTAAQTRASREFGHRAPALRRRSTEYAYTTIKKQGRVWAEITGQMTNTFKEAVGLPQRARRKAASDEETARLGM